MTTLMFVRHAETDLAGTFCGRSDPPLNGIGYQQVEALVEGLCGKGFEAVITSGLLRSRMTAETIAQALGLPVIVEADFRELDFGSWDGLSWNEIEQRDPDYAGRWIREYPNLPAPGGERFNDFRSRVLEAISRLNTTFRKQQIAIITHAGVMRVVLQELCGKTDSEAWVLTKNYCCSFSCRPTGSTYEVLP